MTGLYVRMNAYRIRCGNGRCAAASNSAIHSIFSAGVGALTRWIVGRSAIPWDQLRTLHIIFDPPPALVSDQQ